MLQVVVFVVEVVIVYSLSRALKIHPKLIAVAKPRKEVTLAIIVYVVLFVMAIAWFTL